MAAPTSLYLLGMQGDPARWSGYPWSPAGQRASLPHDETGYQKVTGTEPVDVVMAWSWREH